MVRSRWWVAVVAAALLGGCIRQDDPTPTRPNPPPRPSGSARGTISIDLSSSTGTNARGTVTVVIGDARLVLPVDVSLAQGRTLTVTYDFDSIPAGRTAVLYVSEITVGDVTYVSAGTATIAVTEGQTTTIEASAYTPVQVDTSYTVTGNVQFGTISVPSASVSDPYVTVSGSVSNMDVARVFVYVNDDVFPVTLNLSSGAATFSTIVSLDPGANEIYVVGMNSNGVLVVSNRITVTYTATIAGNTMLATLIWDSPTSDIDLHVWYYRETSPSSSSSYAQHCYYGDMDLDSIRPDRAIDSAGNLDIDDTEGYGPEHMTLIAYPDGYYVFAIHRYSMDQDLVSNCSFTLKVGSAERTIQHTFTTTSTPRYFRCFDVRVQGGVATILAPNTSLLSTLDKALLPPKAK